MSNGSHSHLGLVAVPPTPEEYDFILDAWTRSFRDSPWAGVVTNDKYQETQRWTITSLLARGATLLVATLPDEDRRVAGFVCSEPGTLHYLYVKAAFRKMGVGSFLLQAALPAPGVFTHRTRACGWLLKRGMTWDPVPARTKDR